MVSFDGGEHLAVSTKKRANGVCVYRGILLAGLHIAKTPYPQGASGRAGYNHLSFALKLEGKDIAKEVSKGRFSEMRAPKINMMQRRMLQVALPDTQVRKVKAPDINTSLQQ
jgi:hypothetical protein